MFKSKNTDSYLTFKKRRFADSLILKQLKLSLRSCSNWISSIIDRQADNRSCQHQNLYPTKERMHMRLCATQVEVPSGNGLLIRPCQTNVTYDQTNVRSKHRMRTKCAQNCLWSDLARRKRPLIRPKSEHCPDDFALQITTDQTIPRTKMPLIRSISKHLPVNSRPLSRRLCDHDPVQTQTIVPQLCASDDFWSDYPQNKKATDQTNFSTSSLTIILKIKKFYWFSEVFKKTEMILQTTSDVQVVKQSEWSAWRSLEKILYSTRKYRLVHLLYFRKKKIIGSRSA